MAELTLTETQNGGRFTIHVGDAIDLHLPENASTGYRWSIATLDRDRLSVEREGRRAGGGGVGGGGTATWTLRATTAGATRLRLTKSRKWETGKPPLEQFSVELEITHAG